MLEDYIGYGFGILALISAMIAYQAKRRATLLKISILTGICWVLYFFFEGAYVSAVVCIISTLKLVIFLLGIKHKWADHIVWLFIFLFVTLVSGFSTYQTFLDIIPNLLICNVAFFRKLKSKIRHSLG